MQRLFKFVAHQNGRCLRLSMDTQMRAMSDVCLDDSKFGKDGHYDVVIVGGGAAGLSLAGAICKFQAEISSFW